MKGLQLLSLPRSSYLSRGKLTYGTRGHKRTQQKRLVLKRRWTKSNKRVLRKLSTIRKDSKSQNSGCYPSNKVLTTQGFETLVGTCS